MILSNTNYILTYSNEFRIYSTRTLTLLKTIPEPSCKLFELSNSTIFFTNQVGLFTYSIETQKKEEIVKIVGNARISAIFINGNFLYVGYDNGTLEIYSFNEHSFKLQKTICHPGIVASIKSDNIKTYVTDMRNRLTVYPDDTSYDFIQPKIYFNRYLYVVSEKKVFMNVKDVFGYVFDLKQDVEEVVFSPQGGVMFARNGTSVRAYDTLGTELGRYMSGDFCIILKNGKLVIVEEQGGSLKYSETFLKDMEKVEMQFTKVNIKEKSITTEEYEKKYNYVDDGNKRNFPAKKEQISFNNVSKSNINNAVSDITGNIASNTTKSNIPSNTTINNTTKSNIPSNTTINNSASLNTSNLLEYIYNSTEEEENQSNIEESNIKKTKRQILSSEESEFITNPINNNLVVFRKNPSSYENHEARLLFFSSQGFMISLESILSNQVCIKYHSHEMDSIEIKDTLKSTLGSFYGENYVLSDGKTINYNDIWQISHPCSLLGIDHKFIYAFENNNLSMIDFRGKIVKTIYTPFSYSFCIGEDQMAIFCNNCVMLYKNNEKAEYLPFSDISFGCFDKGILYVKIGKEIFELQEGVLNKVFETEERPLTIYEGSLVTLGENKLLPRPAVKYYPIRNEKVEEIEIDLNQFKKYNY